VNSADRILTDTASNERFDGSSSEDYFQAGEGNDNLFGGEGNDFGNGNEGNDFISGGTAGRTHLNLMLAEYGILENNY